MAGNPGTSEVTRDSNPSGEYHGKLYRKAMNSWDALSPLKGQHISYAVLELELLVANFDFGMTDGYFLSVKLTLLPDKCFWIKLRVKRWSPSRIPESFLVSCPLFVIFRGWGYSKGLIGVGTVGTGVYNTFDSSSKSSFPAMTTDLITMITTVGWWNWGSASGFGESLSQRSPVCPGVGKPLNDHLIAHRASCWILFKMIFFVKSSLFPGLFTALRSFRYCLSFVQDPW